MKKTRRKESTRPDCGKKGSSAFRKEPKSFELSFEGGLYPPMCLGSFHCLEDYRRESMPRREFEGGIDQLSTPVRSPSGKWQGARASGKRYSRKSV